MGDQAGSQHWRWVKKLEKFKYLYFFQNISFFPDFLNFFDFFENSVAHILWVRHRNVRILWRTSPCATELNSVAHGLVRHRIVFWCATDRVFPSSVGRTFLVIRSGKERIQRRRNNPNCHGCHADLSFFIFTFFTSGYVFLLISHYCPLR